MNGQAIPTNGLGVDDTYAVPFQGATLQCKTGVDAVDVTLADRVLFGCDQALFVESLRAANALDRCGRRDDAQRLRTNAAASLLSAVRRWGTRDSA